MYAAKIIRINGFVVMLPTQAFIIAILVGWLPHVAIAGICIECCASCTTALL